MKWALSVVRGTSLVCACVFWCAQSDAQRIVPPEEAIGHRVGADEKLASWGKIVSYFGQVARGSDRVVVHELGKTTEGLPMIVAEISAPDTVRDLDKHRQDQHSVADPRMINDAADVDRLVHTTKPVILVNCNLHSSEVASSQMAMELLYELATGESPQIREILERTVILLVPSANPDGLNKVIDWYERSRNTPWEGSGMPWLYQTYAGHDNNRDWFMLALQETRLLTDLMYRQWRPTIVYDIHQMGNTGPRLFVPPFHDPKNANVHPLIDQSLLIIGGHMAADLARAGKKGVIHGAMYDNWWSGGFRTTPYRHNMVGILTEAASVRIASPVFQTKTELKGAVRGMASYTMTTNFPDPWPGGWWRLRDIVEYEKVACLSLFTLAARYHEMFQSNYLRFAREAIARGQSEPPFAWLIPPDQRDRGTALALLRVLHDTGVEVHRAEQPFLADGVSYPRGTFILYCAQPYRAHLNDLMERQDYPNREEYPGGPAESPYDIAGWTLPLQMGVRHVSVARPFECAATRLDQFPQSEANLEGIENASHLVLRPQANDDYRCINRLHKAGIEFRIAASKTPTLSPGSLVVANSANLRGLLPKLLAGLSVTLVGVGQLDKPIEPALSPVRQPRVGLYQPWTASIDEGWTRLVLENFEFPYTSVHNADVRAGNLKDRYDCLLLPAISTKSILEGREPDSTAPEYVGGIGPEGVVALQEFVRSGGTLVCLDDSCNLPIDHFNIPVKNVLRGKKSQDFYCPGSILRVAVDPHHPVGFGMPEWCSGYFVRSQAFELDKPDKEKDSRSPANRFSATVVARYADTVLLQSGWIRGEDILRDKPAIVEVQYGKGYVVLLGFRVQHRAQPHGTFRLLFNAIARSTLPPTK